MITLATFLLLLTPNVAAENKSHVDDDGGVRSGCDVEEEKAE